MEQRKQGQPFSSAETNAMNRFLESKELLQTVASEIGKLNDEARRLVAGLSDTQLNWKPAADRWSIAQCFDHLAVTSCKSAPFVDKAIARGRKRFPNNAGISYRPSWFGGWLVKQVLPEATRKVPAPKIFRPADSSNIAGAFERFLRQQDAFIRSVRDAQGIDYNKTKLRSPVSPFMRYSLADAFVLNVVHTQRHLGQARNVASDPNFPS